MSGSRIKGFDDSAGDGSRSSSQEVGFRSRGARPAAASPTPTPARSRGPRLRLGRIAVLVGAVGTTLAVAAAALAMPEPHAPDPAAISAASAAPATTAAAKAADAGSASPAAEAPSPAASPAPKATTVAAPADSGSGRRIVFDQSDQRVWLIEQDGSIDRTYLVSGSRFDNLDPGTYDVQSKQRHATSFDYTGSMEYFVRFTTGWSAPIGFHSIPVYNNGEPEQTLAELGTALSAGCVRQKKSDAKYLWDWAPVGTPVVVTA